MREHKRIPKISLSIKRLIATEALRYPDMPRDYLAQSIRDKIEDLGDIPPTDETLKRKISNARANPPKLSHYWHLGLQLEDGIGRLPTEAIPRIIEIQRNLKEQLELKEYPKIPVHVAYWIGQLYKVIDEPGPLFVAANAYALYVIVGQVADKDIVAVDTSELDNMLLNKDYEALAGVAVGFRTLLQNQNLDDVGKDFSEIINRIREIAKNNPKEGGEK